MSLEKKNVYYSTLKAVEERFNAAPRCLIND